MFFDTFNTFIELSTVFIVTKIFSLVFRIFLNLLPINLGIDCNTLISDPVNSYKTNPPDCLILDNCVFENFISADKLFAIALRIFEICVLVNNLSRKLASSLVLPIKFDERFKVTSVPFLF